MSDLPPPSAINNSSKNKKKSKKKNKKQQSESVAVPPIVTPPAVTTPNDISYAAVAALPADNESADVSVEEDASIQAQGFKSDVADSLDTSSGTEKSSAARLQSANNSEIPPVGAPSFAEVVSSDTPDHTLSEPIEYAIKCVIASRSIDIYRIIEEISKKSQAGEYNSKQTSKSDSKTLAQTPCASLNKALPLSDSVKHCIKSTIASGSIDFCSITDSITKKIKAGDYKSSDKEQLINSQKEKPAIHAEKEFKGSQNEPSNSQKDQSETTGSHPLSDLNAGAAIAAVASAVAGTAATISGKLGATANETTKLSDSIQQCIDSAVKAPSVDVDSIVKKPEVGNVKRPEPAVGETRMPSVAKKADIAPKQPDITPPKKLDQHKPTPDVPKKKKKNDCIIL